MCKVWLLQFALIIIGHLRRKNCFISKQAKTVSWISENVNNKDNKIIFSLIFTVSPWKSVLIKGVNWQFAPSLRGKLYHCDRVQSYVCLRGNFRGSELGWWRSPTSLMPLWISFYLSGSQLGSTFYFCPFPFLQNTNLGILWILEILTQNERERREKEHPWSLNPEVYPALLELLNITSVGTKNYTGRDYSCRLEYTVTLTTSKHGSNKVLNFESD